VESIRESFGPPVILGWREWFALPEVGIPAIKAKLDTGARSSSLHVRHMEIFRKGGKKWVRFEVDFDPRNPLLLSKAELPVLDERIVRNSGGDGEHRVVIRTSIEIAGRVWEADVTLTSRHDMRFRMLIGREAMSGRILVDAGRSYLAGRKKKVTRKKVARKKAR